MPHSTTEPVTPSVTFNPYLPAIGRVYEVLLLGGMPGEPIQITNREIADRAGVSAGYVPTLLRRLEHDGKIERVTTATGSLILVLERSDMADRFRASQPADQPCLIDAAVPTGEGTEMPDRSDARSTPDQACLIPPCTPLYGTQENLDQEEESRASDSAILARLMAEPGMNRTLAKQIAAAPLGSLADFERDLQVAETFARNPLYLTVARWRDGQRVTAPQETQHATRQRPNAAYQRSGSGAHSRAAAPIVQPAADDAFLAEVAALNPGRGLRL